MTDGGTGDRWLAIGAPGAISSAAVADHGAVQLVRITINHDTSVTLDSSLLDTSEETNAGQIGHALAFSPDGHLLAVGAPHDGHLDTVPLGTVFLYTLNADGQGFTFAQSISNGSAPTWFGSAVAVANDTSFALADAGGFLVVGAPGQVDAGRGVPGQVYSYSYPRDLSPDSSAPTLLEKSAPMDPDDGLGTTVAVSQTGEGVMIGAPFTSGATESATQYGAAYLLRLDQLSDVLSWNTDLRSTTSPSHDGTSLAITPDGKLVVIGAPLAAMLGRVSVTAVSYGFLDLPSFVDAGDSDAHDVSAGDMQPTFGTSVGVSATSVYVGEPGAFDASPGGKVVVFGHGPGGTLTGSPSIEAPTATVGAGYGTTIAVSPDSYFHAVSAPFPGHPGGAAVYLLR